MISAENLNSVGASCSLCGNTFSSENPAKLVLLTRERYKDTDVFAALCAKGHVTDNRSLLHTYHTIPNSEGFITISGNK